jgi:hypothetical protein
MINNIYAINPILKFDSTDDFYFLQIIKRKKDNPEVGSNSIVIKTYYIRSQDQLEFLMPEIIAICNFHNARACINLNVRSFEKTAFHTMKKISDIIMNRDFKSVMSAYDSVCGEFGAGKNKSWVIDIDTIDEEFIEDVERNINNCPPEGMKIICQIPTKNGYHLISLPFDLREFKFPEIDIHKNNPTILYIP